MRKIVSWLLAAALSCILSNTALAQSVWIDPPQVVPFVYEGATYTHIQQIASYEDGSSHAVYCPNNYTARFEEWGNGLISLDYHKSPGTCINTFYTDGFGWSAWSPQTNRLYPSFGTEYSLDQIFRSTRSLRYQEDVGYDFHGNYGLNEVFPSEQLLNKSVFAAGPPLSVLSPVVGALEDVDTDTSCSGTVWCLNQHHTGAHKPNGGVGKSDDSYAWDANLNFPNYDTDNGIPVYATAPGKVTNKYAGSQNAGGASGQVLIQHKYSNGFVWWSGYLHMTNIQVLPGQDVTTNTVLGYISSTGTNNNHLHFVVYQGANTREGLVSFDATLQTR